MKTILLALGLLVIAGDAHAITRYTSTSMECAEVKQTIANDGAAIMRYRSTRGSGAQLYGRYVRNGGFCSAGERAEVSYIPTADTKQCPVRECKYVSPDDDGFFLRDD